MDEGYILSNKFRKIIFDSIASGEKNINRIAKKHRIIQTVANKVILDFEENGIIKKNGNIVELTDEGKKLAEIV